MKVFKSVKLIGLLLVFALLLVACSTKQETSNEEGNAEPPGNESVTEENGNEDGDIENDNEEDSSSGESEDVSFEVQTPPDDQGGMDVWFEGDFTIVDKVVSIKGRTNLLPESKLTLTTEPEEGILLGGNWTTARVEENGEFELEKKLPSDLEGIVHIELRFDVEGQDEEIKAHYEKEMTGSFVRIDQRADSVSKKAAFQTTITLDHTEQTVSIVPPSWEIPEDIGDANVRIEPAIQREGKYLIVTIESNLVDGTYVSAKADIPGYITTGFNGSAFTNPDGTATMYIEDPEQDSRIKNLEEYEIVITVNPTHSKNGPFVLETYGESGENFSGPFVKEKDDYNYLEQRVKIEAKS